MSFALTTCGVALLMLASLVCITPPVATPGETAARTVRVASQDELSRAIAAARPGDRIVIAAGEYRGFSATKLQGLDAKPILIEGESAQSPPKFTSQIHFSDPAHLDLVNLAIVGAATNGLNIDDGGSFESPAHHIRLRGLVVRDGGGKENADGIKLSGVTDFSVQDCTVERWGRGGSGIDMVGCARGRIERCTLRDRASDSAASGVQAKGGSRDIAIRDCRFEHAGQRAVNIGGSTGMAYFRPKPEGFEAKDVVVEGCTFVGSLSPIAFVGVDGATVRWNTIYLPSKWVLRILQETTAPEFVPCRKGVFSDNLVVFKRADVAAPANVGGNTAPETFSFARNYWFAVDDPSRSIPALPKPEELPAGGSDPRMIDPRLEDPRAGNFGVPDNSPARMHGADAWPGRGRRSVALP